MADLSTTYMGLKLHSPIVVSPSPLSIELGNVRRMEESGAGAIVLYSLFEEQLRMESLEVSHHLSAGTESFAESLSYLPELSEFRVGPDGYLEHIRRCKAAVQVPIIASLNGTTPGGWLDYARLMEQAGADGLELNLYHFVSRPERTAEMVEDDYVKTVRAVTRALRIPVSVKLSPFFSNLAHFAHRLDETGVAGLTLFNRFYQPDVDLENMEIKPGVLLSTPQEMRLPLTWIGILYGRVKADMAATTGIDRAEDVVKMLMVGATVTELCSTLLRNGISHLSQIEAGLRAWMEKHEYASVNQMRGALSQMHSPDPAAFERAQYMRAVKGLSHLQLTAQEAWRIIQGD